MSFLTHSFLPNPITAKEYLPLVPLAGAYAYLFYKIGDFARESEEGGRRDAEIIGNNEPAALEERLELEN